MNSVDLQYAFSNSHASIYMQFLDAGLDKLPVYQIPTGGFVLRGTSAFEATLLKSMNVGEEYIPPFYYSTTPNVNVAIQRTYSGPSPGDIVIRFNNSDFKGVDISRFSRYQEQEILFKANFKFEKGGILQPEFSVNQELFEIILTPKL